MINHNSVTVAPNEKIHASVTVVGKAKWQWQSTGWRIDTRSGDYTCVGAPIREGGNAPQSATYSFDITAPSNAKKYDLYVRVFSSNDCRGNEGDSFHQNDGVIVVEPMKDQKITVTKSAPATAAYGEGFNVAASSDSKLPVAVTASGSCAVSVPGHVRMMSGTGICTVHYNQAGDSSFNPATEVTEAVTASPAPITVTAHPKTKIFGTPDPVLDYDGAIDLLYQDTFSGVLAREAGEDVGIYPINQGTLALGPNYNITFVGNVLTITPAEAVVSLVEPLTFTYDGNPHAATVVTNPLTGFDLSLTYNGDSAAPIHGGTYDVIATASSTNPDYSNGTAKGKLVIEKAKQSIEFGTLTDREIDSGDFTVSATATSGLPVTFTASGACSLADSEVANTIHMTALGTCVVTATQAGDRDYLPVSGEQGVARAFTVFGPPSPTLTPNGGTFAVAVKIPVSLSSEGAASIHYTGDGSIPTCTNGAVYTGPFDLIDPTTITAVACDSIGDASAATSAFFGRNSTGGGAGGDNSGNGSVLGAAIGPVDTASTTPVVASTTPSTASTTPAVASTTPAVYGNGLCKADKPYLSDFIKSGAKNNPDQVKLLQQFLNENLGTKLPVTGVYGALSVDAVKKFQNKYPDQVIKPWNDIGEHIKEGTGYVYKTTLRWINILHCGLPDDAFPLVLP